MLLSTKTPRATAPSYGEVAVPVRTLPVGLVVAASLGAGLVTAAVLAVVLFAGAEEHVITGTVMLAFALGWAALAAGSMLWTDQPQRWAAVPAGFMGLAGAGMLILAPSAAALQTLGWVWPPALLTLVMWMIISARGSCGAALAGGCCTPSSAFWHWRRSVASTRPWGIRSIERLSRREASSSMSATIVSTSPVPVPAALSSCWHPDSAQALLRGRRSCPQSPRTPESAPMTRQDEAGATAPPDHRRTSRRSMISARCCAGRASPDRTCW